MRALVVASLALALTSCAARHVVALDLTSRRPLTCVESSDDPTLVVARLAAPEHRDDDVTYVFDFLTMDGFPRCGAGSVADFCGERTCGLAADRRRCVTIPRAHLDEVLSSVGTSRLRPIDVVPDDALGALLDDAPDGPLMIRLVATLEPGVCEEGTVHRFDPADVLGCAYSCPVVLDEASAPVSLDLDPSFGATCTRLDVVGCAQFLLPP